MTSWIPIIHTPLLWAYLPSLSSMYPFYAHTLMGQTFCSIHAYFMHFCHILIFSKKKFLLSYLCIQETTFMSNDERRVLPKLPFGHHLSWKKTQNAPFLALCTYLCFALKIDIKLNGMWCIMVSNNTSWKYFVVCKMSLFFCKPHVSCKYTALVTIIWFFSFKLDLL